MLVNTTVSGTSAKEPKRLTTKSPMNGNSAATKTLKPDEAPRAKGVRQVVAGGRALVHRKLDTVAASATWTTTWKPSRLSAFVGT
jgi:hypothetical protein